MRSSGWALIQYDRCPYKIAIWWSRDWGDASISPGVPRIASNSRKAWDRFSLRGPRKEPTLLAPWLGTSNLQNSARISFCYFKLPRKLTQGQSAPCCSLQASGSYAHALGSPCSAMFEFLPVASAGSSFSMPISSYQPSLREELLWF